MDIWGHRQTSWLSSYRLSALAVPFLYLKLSWRCLHLHTCSMSTWHHHYHHHPSSSLSTSSSKPKDSIIIYFRSFLFPFLRSPSPPTFSSAFFLCRLLFLTPSQHPLLSGSHFSLPHTTDCAVLPWLLNRIKVWSKISFPELPIVYSRYSVLFFRELVARASSSFVAPLYTAMIP